MLKKRESRQFVVINEEKLISEVQQRPILYDKALKGYRKPTIREHAWQAVADSLHSTVEESKKRWRSLRDAFMKQYKQSQADDPRSVKKKKWLFYDQMEFLVPFLEINYAFLNVKDDEYDDESQKGDGFIYKMEYLDESGTFQNNTTTNNNNNGKEQIGGEDVVDEEEPDNVVDHEIEVNEEIIDVYGKSLTDILLNETNADISPTKNCSIESANSSTDKEIIEMSTDSHVTSSNIIGLNSDERFLLSCTPILKRLSAKKNAFARIKIQQILYEIEFGELVS